MKEDDRLSRSAILGRPSDMLDFAEVMGGGYRLIDVRSPGEYLAGSLPGAINIPIFDNGERSLVGTMYRQSGRDAAIATGFTLVESRLAALLQDFHPYRREPIAVFCARGGMRSRSVVNLLCQSGFAARQLAGGYKAYRQLALDTLERFSPRCIVVHGLTGTGKTRILQHLDPVIDLEDLAQHQSSLFGGINRRPRTQQWFDSRLHQVIAGLGAEPVFIEGESRQIGNIYLPAGLARAMKAGQLVLVSASLATRVARIVEDYPLPDEATVARVERILKSLRSKVGAKVVVELCALLRQNRLAELVEILLVEYYDKRYLNNLRHYHWALTISSENIGEAAAILTEFRRQLLREALRSR
ncbi:MAG: tRNA 2-selenouridine(34) synthase MnmH [Desulfopila sp.]